jgi:hypothetical protein
MFDTNQKVGSKKSMRIGIALWRPVDAASAVLDSAERDAVCEDLAESGEPEAQPCGSLLGLEAHDDRFGGQARCKQACSFGWAGTGSA